MIGNLRDCSVTDVHQESLELFSGTASRRSRPITWGGRSFMEQELNRAQVAFRKNDNAFLAVDDVATLQAAADRLSHRSVRRKVICESVSAICE